MLARYSPALPALDACNVAFARRCGPGNPRNAYAFASMGKKGSCPVWRVDTATGTIDAMVIKRKGPSHWQVDIQPGGRGAKRLRKTFKTKAEALWWHGQMCLHHEPFEPWRGAETKTAWTHSFTDKSATAAKPLPAQSGSTTPRPGFIYLMRCSSHAEDVFKVGFTTRAPSARAKELSNATGVPTDFTLLAQWEVERVREAELRVFHALAKYRLNSNREFFVADRQTLTQTICEVLLALKIRP